MAYFVIDRIDAGCTGAHEQLVLSRLRDWDVVQFEYFRTTEPVDAYCLHCSPSSTSKTIDLRDADPSPAPGLRCTSQSKVSKPHCWTLTLVKWPNLDALTNFAGSGNTDSLNVHELFDAVMRELAPVAALLDAAKG